MKRKNAHANGARLRLAIPNKGRLFEPTIALLQKIGLAFETADRTLSTDVRNFPLEILYVAARDVPEFVADEIVDLGITGLDLVAEYGAPLQTIECLGYGHAGVVVAVPEDSPVREVAGLRGKKIATVYPNTARRFLRARKVRAVIVEVEGAVEATPSLGVADAILDITSSGTSLRTNRLRVIAHVLRSEAALVARKGFVREHPDARSLAIRIESVVTAQQKRYLMMNAPARILPKIKQVAPGLSSPTVMKLAQPGMIAVHSVVNAEETFAVVEKLRALGATGILIIPIERMIE